MKFKKILITLTSIILISCNSNDSKYPSSKIMEVGESKLDKSRVEANLNKDYSNANSNTNFEDQINTLKELGLQLNPDIDINEIFDGEFGKTDFEQEGILFTLREIGRSKFKKNKGRVHFGKNVYTLVSEDFNIDKSTFRDLFKNISRISNQKIIFKDMKFINFDNASLEKGISFKIGDNLISWNFNFNEGYFDANLIPKICEVMKMKGVHSIIWSHDGLSHTILVGDIKFINRMSNYLNKQPC